MGADMLLGITEAPITADGLECSDLRRICARAREQVFVAVADHLVDLEEYVDIVEFATPEAAADAVYAWLDGGGLDSREVTTIRIDGRPYVASGGMSWGDAPTDAYLYLCLLDAAHAFTAPI